MSADTHKYGYAAKGTSVVLYRDKDLRHQQYYRTAKWAGGLYFSPTFAGSRPGALSAACWAAMVSLGEEGYLDATRRILEAAQRVKEGLAKIDGVDVIGDPLWNVAFTTDGLDVYRVLDVMGHHGWSLNGLQDPPSVHLCVTLRHTQPGVVDRFLADLAAGGRDGAGRSAGGRFDGTDLRHGDDGRDAGHGRGAARGVRRPALRALIGGCAMADVLRRSSPMREWGLPLDGELDRVVVVSPHLDDAVLGCGRFLAAHPGATVVTVFAGNPPQYPEPMRKWDVQSGFAPGDDVMETRRNEDHAALACVGATPVHLDLDRVHVQPGRRRGTRPRSSSSRSRPHSARSIRRWCSRRSVSRTRTTT